MSTSTAIDPTKIVTATVGSDVLTVPAGTQLVNGNGGADTVLLGTYQYFAEFQIVRNADGSITVTDEHGGTLINTQMIGISVLRFGDGCYDVGTGQFIAAAAVVNGTAGNDTLSVPAGTQLVDGNGGTDVVAFGAYQYFAEFQIVRNANGSIGVTDLHGGTLTNTQMVGIGSLQFGDGTYNVATGQFTSGAVTAVPPVTAPPSVVTPPAINPANVVTGTPGNDLLTLPAGTQLVNGDGGTDTVVFGAYQYYAGFQIVRNADGSIDLTDVHGGTLTNTQLIGIATLQFGDGSYNVSTGVFTAGTAPSPSTGGGTVPAVPTVPSGLLVAPAVGAPQHSGDVVGLLLQNSGTAPLASRIVTFGQSFADGDVPAGSTLVATINGQQVAVQMDVKSTNADGSIAEAVLTLDAPAIAANGSAAVMLSRSAAPQAAAIDPHGFVASGYDAQVNLTFHNANGTTGSDSINVGGALTQALAAGTAKSWLSGPLASEVQISVPVNGAMAAQFNIRENADGTFVTDVQLLNNGIFNAASASYTYDVAITSHGQILASQTNVVQAPMQDWEQVLWSNSKGAAQAPGDQIVYDVAYLEKAGAVGPYATASGVDAGTVAGQISALAGANTGPLGAALVTQYEPTTGARPDIGPTTQWGANWLVSQSAAAEQVMLDNAAAAAAEPIHAVNPDGTPLTTANDPGFWLDGRNTTNPQTVNYSTVETESGWTMDNAHIPDLTYLAALTTGSESALEQLQAQANYDLLSIAPAYRANDSTMIGEQQRGIAWTIRDVANAAYLTPNTDPQKAFFTGQLNAIIQNLDANFVHGALGAAEGSLHGYIMGAFDTNQVAPWEQGYIVIALGQACAQGFTAAADVLGWMNNFISGLYLNGANGYNPLEGSGYWLTTGTGSVSSGNYQGYTSWAQLYAANFAGQPAPTSLNGYPNDPVGGFSTIAKAALAVEWNVTHAAQDLAAYAYITQLTPFLIQDPSGYAASQTWDLTPTLANGHQLQNSEVYYGNGGATTAATADGLLAAASGNNVLQAGSGDSILIGGSGTDVLNGGAGNDFLFAGTGTQTLYGGPGRNTLEGHLNGGTGVDSFLFKAADTATDTVINFEPGTDKLEISGAPAGMTAASLLAAATADAAGDVVLHLSVQHTVVLTGVTLAHLTVQSLLFV